MGEYHDLYLKTDTILLANVFESFRSVFMKNYGLDPAHFYTAPGLAWKACLKKTGIRLELLLDPDMLLMFEQGIVVESHNQCIDGQQLTTHTWKSTIVASQPNTFSISMLTTYTVGQCLNHCPQVNSNGLSVVT